MESIEQLIAEYERWMKEQGLDLGSADEHVTDPSLTPMQRLWLMNFIERWDRAQRREDERYRLLRDHPQPTAHLRWKELEAGETASSPQIDHTSSAGYERAHVLVQWWEYDDKPLRQLHGLPVGEWREVQQQYDREEVPE